MTAMFAGIALGQTVLILWLCAVIGKQRYAIKRFEAFAVTVAESFENIQHMVQQLEQLHEISRCLDEAQRPVERFH